MISALAKTRTFTREQVEELLAPLLKTLPLEKYPLVAFGLRGANLDMGVAGVNDRGIWDDLNGWLDRKTGEFHIYTANTDPTAKYRKNLGSVHAPQILWFKIGKHKGRDGFRQADTFKVDRDGVGLVDAPKDRAFNWHDSIAKSGGTSSEGCQTNPKEVFKSVLKTGYPLVRKYYPKTETFPFVLVDLTDWEVEVPLPAVLKNPRSLAKGMRGDAVKALQQALDIKDDGIFGNGTESSVRKFQKDAGITADGIAGPVTLDLLGIKEATKDLLPEMPGKIDLDPINDAAEALVKEFESLRLDAYLDSGGVPTIGWGTTKYPHTGKAVKMGDKCTKAEADAWFWEDINEAVAAVKKAVRVPVTPNQFGAMVSLTYNIGVGAFKSSTMLALLNKGDYTGASNQFPRWNKDNGKVVAGLTRRRKAERALFIS